MNDKFRPRQTIVGILLKHTKYLQCLFLYSKVSFSNKYSHLYVNVTQSQSFIIIFFFEKKNFSKIEELKLQKNTCTHV